LNSVRIALAGFDLHADPGKLAFLLGRLDQRGNPRLFLRILDCSECRRFLRLHDWRGEQTAGRCKYGRHYPCAGDT
jgi:hypothetical protein